MEKWEKCALRTAKKQMRKAIDPDCFMVVTQVTEVWGRGFSSGKRYV